MLSVENLTKEYRTGRDPVPAVTSLSFRLGTAEVLSLVGPSGCGKTTVLRCVAGLETPDAGTITIGDSTMFSSATGKNVPAHRRTIAMVFQSYAIWPHMTVFDNVAYPLVARRPRLAKQVIKDRVHESLDLLQIGAIADRRATQLSGGQQQRVAIARALVRRAPVLLLDEPLSNLDAQLREATRGELRELFTKLGVSVLYVTHDIGEALVLSDRLMVLSAGRLLEEGAPEEIYVRPKSVVVAEFLGASQFVGTTRAKDDQTMDVEWSFGRHAVDKENVLVDRAGVRVCVLVRPTFVEISATQSMGTGNGLRPVQGTIESVLFLGSHVQYRVRAGADVVTAQRPPHEHRFAVGESVFIQVDPRGIVVIPLPRGRGGLRFRSGGRLAPSFRGDEGLGVVASSRSGVVDDADIGITSEVLPPTDKAVLDIAQYVVGDLIDSPDAYRTARYSLLDSLACAALAVGHEACLRFLGPEIPGTVVPCGARVPGTAFQLAPSDAAFDIGCLIRWLDFNDTWLAAEWGHPSDNLGGILAVADHVSRVRAAHGEEPLVMRDVLTAMVKAYEVQGILSLANSFNRAGFDHVLLVRVATAAVAGWLLGGDEGSVAAGVAHAWLDGGALRAYRHAPNVTWRKSWAAADATSRGVRLAQLVRRGAAGCRTPLSAPIWGVSDVMLGGRPVTTPRPYGTYTMTKVIWKASFPGEVHGQTAVEGALRLHDAVRHRLDEIDAIAIRTQESALRIIDKQGQLRNPADRDHCLQYMVAVALIHGELTSLHYEGPVAADPRIDRLRARTTVAEDPVFSRDYLAPNKRSVANTLEVLFRDGSSAGPVTVEYPIGHPRRRQEGVAAVQRKFEAAIEQVYPAGRCEEILAIMGDQARLEQVPVHDFMAMLSTPGGTQGERGPMRDPG